MDMVLTNSDIRHCIETYRGLTERNEEDTYDGPETAMITFGYADVCLDGDVVARGRTLINVADLEIDDVPDDDEPCAAAMMAHCLYGEE
jgi:hypothetical protein